MMDPALELVGGILFLAFMTIVFGVVAMGIRDDLRRWNKRKRAREETLERSHEHARRQRQIASRPSAGPCRACGNNANAAGHECTVTLTINTISVERRGRTYGTRYHENRWRAVVEASDGSVTTCPHDHTRPDIAERCGELTIRRLQVDERSSTIAGLPGAAWKEMMRKVDYQCHYCKRRFDPGELERDHAIPISRGGSNHASNIVVSCATCNRRKGSMTTDEFLGSSRHPDVDKPR